MYGLVWNLNPSDTWPSLGLPAIQSHNQNPHFATSLLRSRGQFVDTMEGESEGEKLVHSPEGAGGSHQARGEQWSTGLFDCLEDIETCFCGCLCPGCLIGSTQAIVDSREGEDPSFVHTCMWCCGWYCLTDCALCCLVGGYNRKRIMRKYNIQGHPNQAYDPWLMHWLCFYCAACQEAREVNRREGFSRRVPFKRGGDVGGKPIKTSK